MGLEVVGRLRLCVLVVLVIVRIVRIVRIVHVRRRLVCVCLHMGEVRWALSRLGGGRAVVAVLCVRVNMRVVVV